MEAGLHPHPLDNHLWHALDGPLADYSRAVGRVRLLTPDIAPVAAIEDASPTNLAALASALEPGDEIVAIFPQPLMATDQLELLGTKAVLQMVAENPMPSAPDLTVERLGPADFDRMRALVDIARPGPLHRRALELGDFFGISDGKELVALAGERLRVGRYTEVASVCTHPDHRGRNYATAVVSAVLRGIATAGSTPFLGVDDGNTAAIRLYEKLGFSHRSTFHLSFMRRVATY